MEVLEIREFLAALGASEEPFGMYYTDSQPSAGICPKIAVLPTREDEKNRRIDWKPLNDARSCVIGLIWRARKKFCAAYFDQDHFGCLGGAFYLGYMKSQLDAIACYVSTGIPGTMEGERYLASPEITRNFFESVGPRPAPARYCVFKPISLFREAEYPELVMFFERPEVMSGLCTMTAFITNDFEAVKSPFGAGCTALVTWPLKYMSEGPPKAVLGGWDPSERKYLGRDEITLSMPYQMFSRMIHEWRNSFLTTRTWSSLKNRRDQAQNTHDKQ
jgi:hypothetical protein